jgi:putative chitobiose transport system substrate-binding protein
MARCSLRRGIRLCSLVLTACVCLILTSCAPGGSSSGSNTKQSAQSGPVTITFWTINLKQNYGSYIQGLINGYHAAHPNVTVNWVDVPGNDIIPKFLSALAAPNPPDVVNLAAEDVPQFAPSLADIGQYLSANTKATYIPSQYQTLNIDGKQVGVPWYNGGGWVTWYNKAMVTKAGLDPNKPPTTWAEALAWGKKIHQSDPSVYGFNQIPDTQVLQAYGIPMLSSDNKKAAFDTPAAVQVLNQWKSYYKSAIAPGAIATPGVGTFPQDFCNGQVAMAVNAQPFQLLNYKTNCPEVYQDLQASPTVTGTTDAMYLGGLNALVVPAKSTHQVAAASFAAWVTNAANQLAFCKLVAIFPSTIQSLNNPFFHTFTNDTTGQARKIVVQELPRLKPFTLGTAYDSQLEQDLQNEMTAFFLGQESASQALQKAASEWNSVLAQ